MVREPSALGDLWRIPREKNPHPASFPLELVARALSCTIASGAVIDPFAGSGTTGKACSAAMREFTLIERNADYLPLIENSIGAQSQTHIRMYGVP